MLRKKLTEEINNYLFKNFRAVLKGLPGVGKTQFVHSMALNFYNEYSYIDCETDLEILDILKNEAEKGISYLLQFFKNQTTVTDIEDYKYLIFFDNIDNCDIFFEYIYPLLSKCRINMIMSLSVINENTRKIINNTKLFELHPFSYLDFLTLEDYDFDKSLLFNNINTLKTLPDFLHKNSLTMFDEFLTIGGMPLNLSVYFNQTLSESSYKYIHETTYMYVMNKLFERGRLDEKTKKQCFQIIESIFNQMIEGDYNKYIISKIREGVTFSTYKKAFEFLEDNNVIIKIHHLENPNKFLYYFYDTGLLSDILLKLYYNKYNCLNMKELLLLVKRNYIATEFLNMEQKLYYWKSRYSAIVDFVIYHNNKYKAIKVFNQTDFRNKSLLEFNVKYPNSTLIHISTEKIKKNKNSFNIPIYSIWGILNIK